MKRLTLRLTDQAHAEITRRAQIAGLCLTEYVRQATLAEDGLTLLREVHQAVCGNNGSGLPIEGKLALAGLCQQGMPHGDARRLVEAVQKAQPGLKADQIILQAYRRTP